MTQSDMTNYSMGFQSLGDDMRTTRLHYIIIREKVVYTLQHGTTVSGNLHIKCFFHLTQHKRNSKPKATVYI